MKKFLPRTANNPQGFTLVELMVVITIIAILSVVGVTVFSGVQKNARDAARRADIDSISNAWEAHFGTVTQGIYPALDPTWFSSSLVPLDPTSKGAYVYVSGANRSAVAATYKVCADLESAGTNTAGGGNDQDYCKSNQQ